MNRKDTEVMHVNFGECDDGNDDNTATLTAKMKESKIECV